MATKRTFPARTLEQALRVPRVIREKNGGNPWATTEVAKALGLGVRSGNLYYVTAASRDFGLTEGTRETAMISLTDLGRRAVYPQSEADEQQALLDAFLHVDVFRKVLLHYGGNNLPERQFLANTLEQTFGIDPKYHDEFVDLFNKNCRYLGIGSQFTPGTRMSRTGGATSKATAGGVASSDTAAVTVATPKEDVEEARTLFVIMPFTERDEDRATGFFQEVLDQLFVPAGTEAGFTVKTARRQGTDVIQSTIINELLEADLVLADLTEHNPNVLFELGIRMHADLPIALVRSRGTGQIFDVDYMLRVEEYDPNLWKSTIEHDLPAITVHIKATWENREADQTFMRILRRDAPAAGNSPPN
jgi:hypothetical protein